MIIGDFNSEGLAHSYQNEPPGYSEPQILYKYRHEGFIPPNNAIVWSVDPPFYIVSGQGTLEITLRLVPELSYDCYKIVSGRTVYPYANINIKVGNLFESRNLYYKQGPTWLIEGNKKPIIEISPLTGKVIQKIETYTIIPKYNQIGYPPKCATLPDSYTFKIKNGKIMKFYGGIPPHGNPMVDIFWYKTGSTYLSFYSSWIKDTIKFPNTININVS